MTTLILRDVVKRYGSVVAVKGISLEVQADSFVALVGPSGCGKTTALRMIAGLEDITGGEILMGGEVINDVAPKDRDIAMVFQSYALYPHMTVRENIAFGLKMRGIAKDEISNRIDAAARMLDIAELLERRPKQLSGGQRQRVAMGRAMVRRPQLFLFDEPLSNLDAKLRVQMRTELKRIRQQVKTTTVYVTHDQVEAMTLADQVVVMNKGLIEQVGSPADLYSSPRTRFVAGFIGSPAMNFLGCVLCKTSSGLVVDLGDGHSLPVPPDRSARYQQYVDRELIFGIRPEHIGDLPDSTQGGLPAPLTASLDVVEPLGGIALVFFAIRGVSVCAQVRSASTPLCAGDPIRLYADMAHMHLVDPTTDLVL